MFTNKNRETYTSQLYNLSDQVLYMGSMVEQAIRLSIKAFQEQDHNSARKIIQDDQKINEKRYSLENKCIELIATQQPMGKDVRFLTAVLEIITELERIGDYAKGISKITLLIPDNVDDHLILDDLVLMTEKGLSMLGRALAAFVNGDVETARQIPMEDDEVDNLYNRIAMELTRLVIADPEKVYTTNYLMWAAHNLERLADRVTNICERTVYVSTGEMKENG
jgi:phosphate transport system protein